MIRKLVTVGSANAALLRQRSEEVPEYGVWVKWLVKDMYETLDHHHGAGLAAIQLGEPWRIIVISYNYVRLALINPRPLTLSTELYVPPFSEGCLSVPDSWHAIQRSKYAQVQFNDVDGQTHVGGFMGNSAVIVQHELDHLDGVLFTDRAGR